MKKLLFFAVLFLMSFSAALSSVYAESSVPASSMPMEKSLQAVLPLNSELPACQALRSNSTNWVVAPLRSINKWLETLTPANPLRSGWRLGSIWPVNNSETYRVPKCPNGKLILWITIKLNSAPGRASACADATNFAFTNLCDLISTIKVLSLS